MEDYYIPGMSDEFFSDNGYGYDYGGYAPQSYYQEPAYTAPSYAAPAYEPQAYQEPVYEQPAYTAPAYEQSAYQEPAYTAPVGTAEAPAIDLGGWNYEDYQKQFTQGAPSQADAVNRYIADQAAQGRELVYDPNQQDMAYQIAMNSAVPLASSGPSYTNFDPNNPGAGMGEVFRFDIGKNEGTAPAVLAEGKNYVLTDAAGENVLGRANTAEEMKALIEQSNAQRYGWNLYQGDDTGEFTKGAQLFGESDPREGGIGGALINYGIPLAVGIATGGAGLLPSMACLLYTSPSPRD